MAITIFGPHKIYISPENVWYLQKPSGLRLPFYPNFVREVGYELAPHALTTYYFKAKHARDNFKDLHYEGETEAMPDLQQIYRNNAAAYEISTENLDNYWPLVEEFLERPAEVGIKYPTKIFFERWKV